MSEDEIIQELKQACILDTNCYEVDCLTEKSLQAIRSLLDLYQQKCKQNKDAKDYIEYYLLDNISIEGNTENTHKELKKLYNMLGGDNLR